MAIAARIAGVSSVMVGFIITLSAGAVLDSAHWEADDWAVHSTFLGGVLDTGSGRR